MLWGVGFDPPTEIKLPAPQSCDIADFHLLIMVAGKKFSQNCKNSVLGISSSKTENGTEI